jgi:hypothetical protein
MNLPDFLTLSSMGEIRVTGHRIDLYLLPGPGMLRIRGIVEEQARVREKT